MISVRFGYVLPSSFKGYDQNVKVFGWQINRQQTVSDDNSSHGLWPGDLKMLWAFLMHFYKESFVKTWIKLDEK